MVEFIELPTAWKIIVEMMTDNVVISEVDASICVVLNKGKKHVPYRELLGTTECTTI
jgi:hypothetical protein